MKPSYLNQKLLVCAFFVTGALESCNGVPRQTMTNDSIKNQGKHEQDGQRSGGAGDSAKLKRSDSSRVVHGGELKK